MKHIAYTGALIAALCLADIGMAQKNPAVPPAVPATAPVPSRPESDSTTAESTQAKADYTDAQADYQKVQAEVDRNSADYQNMARNLASMGNFDMARNLASMGNFAYTWGGSGSAGRGGSPLIIRTSETDAKTMAMEQEDLTIMGRILDKVVTQKDGDERPEAMGIKLITVGGSGGARNMEIEGYGAIFMLNVNFPLVGPADIADEGENKEPTNSTWDEAKREVYGQPGGADGNPFGPRFSKEEFDPKRVEKLKDALLDALKNASNMRSLKPDDSVTVVVTSSSGRGGGFTRIRSGGRTVSMGGGGSSGGGGFGGGRVALPPPAPPLPAVSWAFESGQPMRFGDGGGVESVLTIRVKKLDIDAFAKGKATVEDFRKRATVLIY